MKNLCPLLLLFPAALVADDLAPYSDEFDNAATFSRWQNLAEVEGWVAPAYEAADIDTTEDGHFHIVPAQNTWFGHLRGLLLYKEVTGDFVVTAKLRILSRHNPGDPTEVPNRSFSLSGIFVHGLRDMTQAAPDPYTTSAVWPPEDFGSDYLPNTENYIFLSYGTALNAGTRQFEIKATRNSNSQLYYSDNGIDQNETEVWLQMVRVGDTVVCMRKHGEAEPWIVENRYPNADHPFPDFGETLQVGITAYSDWSTASPYNSAGLEASYHYNYAPPAGNPDLISQVDYFRFRRPDAALTELVLQGMSVSYNPANNTTANPPVELSASPAASPYLGENANLIYNPFGDWVTAQFGGSPAPEDITPEADPDEDRLTNLMEFVLGSDPEDASLALSPQVAPAGGALDFRFTPNINDGAFIEIRRSTNMVDWTTVGSREYEGGNWSVSGGASVDVNETTNEVTLSIPASTTPQFLQLQATQL